MVVWVAAASSCLLAAAGSILASQHFRLPVDQLAGQLLRLSSAPILAVLYREDENWVRSRTASYWHGLPGNVSAAQLPPTAPFVYEDLEELHLTSLRETYRLQDLISGSPSEYEAILRLGGWIGSQFDHGTDPVIGGNSACAPAELIEEGRRGKKFWCEIAARLMVHAATSVGLPSRAITASTDGYTWEHAVAEVWSNEFQKWFVVDPDFNIVYEYDGVPQSAAELVQFGAARREAGTLHVRRIAPAKPSIPAGDALYVYQYVHVDLRNDWCTRRLRPGSPAGGDRATWWYATPELGDHLLTAKVRISQANGLSLPLNTLSLLPLDASGSQVALAAFSPYFSHFELNRGSGWSNAGSQVILPRSDQLRARIVTKFGWHGPQYELKGGALRLLPASGAAGKGRA